MIFNTSLCQHKAAYFCFIALSVGVVDIDTLNAITLLGTSDMPCAFFCIFFYLHNSLWGLSFQRRVWSAEIN